MSECGEQASPHLVIDVVIQASGARPLEAARARPPAPRSRLRDIRSSEGCATRLRGDRRAPCAGVGAGRSGVATAVSRQQVESRGPADRCPAVGHARAWRRCSWCASASCSGTHGARGRWPGRPARFRAAAARPVRVRSVGRSGPVSWGRWLRSCSRRPGADGHSSALVPCFATALSKGTIGGPSSAKIRT